jgi:hypothetical protein
MKYPILTATATAMIAALISSSAASAGDLQSKISSCLARHANANQAAAITLECTAGDGKLANCKVVESNAPSKGFEAAAMCVAEAIPMAGKTGQVRVPVRFPGS